MLFFLIHAKVIQCALSSSQLNLQCLFNSLNYAHFEYHFSIVRKTCAFARVYFTIKCYFLIKQVTFTRKQSKYFGLI